MDVTQARDQLAAVAGADVSGDGHTLTVSVPADQWRATATLAKDTLGCRFFSFVSAVDWKDDGLEVVAWVDNLDQGFSLLLKCRLGAGVTTCDSLVPVYRGAGWMERECYEMFGIQFEGHPDLRRLLLPEDWNGFPLLKSYDVDTPYPPYR